MSVGKDITIDELMQQGFVTVFIAVGVQACQKLRIEGEELKGVIPALEFLKSVNLGKHVEIGRKVAVIGGGNVAEDGTYDGYVDYEPVTSVTIPPQTGAILLSEI